MMRSEFSAFALNPQLLQAVEEMGWSAPTEIQLKAIPPALAGQDLLGIAQTGTGKTGAFLLPALMRARYALGDAPRVLVLSPTRELAFQTYEESLKLARFTDLRCAAAYGGVGMKSQQQTLEAGADVVIGTPGRIWDLYAASSLVLKQIQCMVLDEADRMMDMGFMPQIRKLLEVLPRKRQNLLFSATMPDIVQTLAGEFLEFPTRIEVTPQATPAQTVTQQLYEVPNFLTKIRLLQWLLEDEAVFHKVIVFTRTKEHANNIFKFVERKVAKGSVRVIHANKDQNTRLNSLAAFKAGDVRILVATDVAARGIDVSQVSHVINFDVPFQHEEYVHRIGRTGRAQQRGQAITFCHKAERWHIRHIEQLINMTIPVLPMPEAVEVAATSAEEYQQMAREIDRQKRKDDPDFKGAFHDKKHEKSPTSKKRSKSGKGKKPTKRQRR